MADQPAPQPALRLEKIRATHQQSHSNHKMVDWCDRCFLLEQLDQARRDAAELAWVREKYAASERERLNLLSGNSELVHILSEYADALSAMGAPEINNLRQITGVRTRLTWLRETLAAAQAEVARLRAMEERAQSLHNCELIGCLQCGPTNCDEDGTCMTCGMDTTLAAPSALLRWILTGTPADAPEGT